MVRYQRENRGAARKHGLRPGSKEGANGYLEECGRLLVPPDGPRWQEVRWPHFEARRGHQGPGSRQLGKGARVRQSWLLAVHSNMPQFQ